MTVSRNFYDFADDLKNIGARMMTDWEFAQLHSGTPEETNIYGSANPTTVGGHVDTASRRIVSNIGWRTCPESGGHGSRIGRATDWRGLFRSNCVRLR